MAATPQLKLFNPSKEYVASAKYYEDAAAFVAFLGEGAQVKFGHSLVLWTEGEEQFSAAASYDEAADVMRHRLLSHRDKIRELTSKNVKTSRR